MLRLAGPLPRIALGAVLVMLLLLSLHLYAPSQARHWPMTGAPGRKGVEQLVTGHAGEHCEGLTGLERVVITVKTGATEAATRIPVQMRTSLRCAPHVLVFSDMAQTIGDLELHDVLDETADEVKDGNPAFEIYRKQQALKDPQKIMSQLKGFKTPGTDEVAAWTLDKYKNMHLVEKAWALKPDMDWYLHIDADTYVMLPSLAEWVRRLDPKKHLYLGKSIPTDGVTFAHGGSGILLSGEAMRKFAVENAGTAARWDPKVDTSCCGDILLSRALFEVGIPRVLDAWPSINGESPSSMPFGERQWCEPIVAMHHVTVDEMEAVGRFEISRPDATKPVSHEEFFNGIGVPIADYPAHKKHWDNMVYDYISPGTILNGIESADACDALCAEDEACFQARFDGGECALLSMGFVVGKEHMPDGSKRWDSFWNRTRIENWIASQPACPSPLRFPHQLDD